MNYAYLLRCADGSLYAGWANDLDARVRAHNTGAGGKYTRSRLPVELVYFESFETREQAMSREWHLKRLTRAKAGAARARRGTKPVRRRRRRLIV